MHKWAGLLLLAVAVLVTGCGEETPTTQAVVPSATLTATPTPGLIHTVAPTATVTLTSTATVTPTPSPTPSPTTSPTLAEPIIRATAVMPGVEQALAHSAESTPMGRLPSPAATLPNATLSAPPFYAWVSFESDHPALEYRGAWHKTPSRGASRGQYHYTVDPAAVARFTFEGTAVQVRYVAYTNAGRWQLWLDGAPVATIEGYRASAGFLATDIFPLAPGRHTLEIRPTGDTHPASSDHMVALDAIHVYRPAPPAKADQPTPTPTTTPRPAQAIEVLRQAPTQPPTPTAQPPGVVQVAVVIAYDENANRAVDPAEGVRGIPLRLVEAGTNRVLAGGVTDETGFASLQAVTHHRVRLVVPYFGAYWEVRAGEAPQSFTLLIPPGNQPGLIP